MAQRLAKVKSLAVPRQQLEWLVVPAALGLCILAAFWPGLHSGFHSDDFILITEAQLNHFNLTIFNIDPAWWFYRPFSKLVWLCMYRLWGLNSTPYHLVSLGLHWLNTLLVVALAQCLTGRPRLAFGAGLLFALLPFHVESVVWLASQYDLLAAFGYLAALYGLLLFWRKHRAWWYLFSLLAYQISLWSKELAFTLPMMVVVLWVLARDRPRARVLAISLLPYLALLGVNLLQRYLAWGSIGGYATASNDYAAFVWDHLAGTLALMLGPLHRLIFPASVVQIWMLGITAVVIAGLMAGLNQRVLLLAFAWLGLTLLPALNIMPPGPDLQNTRQLYLPGVGLSIGLVALLDAIVERYAVGRRAIFISSIGVMSLLYAAMLWVQIQPWVVAGREATHVVEELHRFVPSFPAGSRLQVVGLPDNYEGAYIFRLGFDHAYAQRYGSVFQLDPVAKLPEPASHSLQSGNIFQVEFVFDAATTRWEIAQARAVLESVQPLAMSGPPTRWDFSGCTGANGWNWDQTQGRCANGNDLDLISPNSIVSMYSPQIQLPYGWTEVMVNLDIGSSSGAAMARMSWATEDNTWSNAQSETINLRAGRHSYIFFLRPGTAHKPITQLRFTAENITSSLIVQRISLSAIP